ncbi:hypothetical protein ElyMa_000427700 [Elysia marginata]|uniref:Uncharacterized protein n=1 Tax=Elysia marginata TaxID=1093978 RepID=A0AAV4FNC7_9GAST|nr:hypothetical protein ElyMa_000427700 [Elysia marginata]
MVQALDDYKQERQARVKAQAPTSHGAAQVTTPQRPTRKLRGEMGDADDLQGQKEEEEEEEEEVDEEFESVFWGAETSKAQKSSLESPPILHTKDVSIETAPRAASDHLLDVPTGN